MKSILEIIKSILGFLFNKEASNVEERPIITEEKPQKVYITEAQLKEIYLNSTKDNRTKYIDSLNQYFNKYDFTTEQICAFLAQIGHESGQLRYNEELASGEAYEGRQDLGNTEKGDGKRFKGRGLIQITGRYNYTQISKDLGVDFVSNPQLLSEPKYAVWSAFWFWMRNDLNRFATDSEEDFKTLTRKINGGYNGLQDRINIWQKAKGVLL